MATVVPGLSGRDISVPVGDLLAKDSASQSQTIKFGVSTPLRDGAPGGELIILHNAKPLSDAVHQACQRWGYVDPSLFALKWGDPPGHYVTEESRKDLNGKLVIMFYSPAKVCTDLLEKLKVSDERAMILALTELTWKASDPTLADAFVNQGGLTFLVELISQNGFIEKEKPFQLASKVLLDLMSSSSTASWDQVRDTALPCLIKYVNVDKGATQDRLALPPVLQILETMLSLRIGNEDIEKDVSIPVLITHMSVNVKSVNNNSFFDSEVQQNILAFINTLLSKAEPSRLRIIASTLSSKQYRSIVNICIIGTGERPAETNHQLYVLQTLLLNLLDEKKLTPVEGLNSNAQDEALDRIKDLCKIAFHSDAGFFSYSVNTDSSHSGKQDKPNYSREYKKLGFTNTVKPTVDFVSPPGILALDCMYHLATNHTEAYNKLVMECAYRGVGDEFLLPFARASISLTNALCDILRIGDPPGDQQGKFYPFFFQHDKPFEELFCICAQLVTKTWKEMRASVEDFEKVFDVVREQIRRALDIMPENFAKFHEKLNSLTYTEITKLRAQERTSREEDELQAKPILELRQKLVPEVQALINQNRINFMIAGTRFSKFASKGLVSASATTLKRIKEKFWYCRLSPNGKTLHYGDCDEKVTPQPEMLSNKITVLEIKELLTGKECPHMTKKDRNWPFAFSLVKEREPLSSLDFVAPDEKAFAMWTDGINALLGKPMDSKYAREDMDTLLQMEIKLRLLDIEGITIPQEPPPIPPPPPNYDFGSFTSNAQ